jgi:hypothetical protein
LSEEQWTLHVGTAAVCVVLRCVLKEAQSLAFGVRFVWIRTAMDRFTTTAGHDPATTIGRSPGRGATNRPGTLAETETHDSVLYCNIALRSSD